MTRQIESAGWFAAPNAIFDSGLPPNAIAVYLYLCRLAGSTGHAWPSHPTIAKACGMCEKTVRNTIQVLIDAGFLDAQRQFRENGSKTSNLYLPKNPVTDSPTGNRYRTPPVTDTGPLRTPSKKKILPSGEELEKKRTRARPESQSDVIGYFHEKGETTAEAERFWLFYGSKGWMVGKSPMKDWRMAASGWISRNRREWTGAAVGPAAGELPVTFIEPKRGPDGRLLNAEYE